VLLVGVGGQGVLLASTVLGEVARAAGLDVKKSEVHGMAKRGGVVFSHVRFGEVVWSPLIGLGEADALVAFEWAEGLRWLPYLRSGGLLVIDPTRIVPPAAQQDHRAWTVRYPELDPAPLARHRGPVVVADARDLAMALGTPAVANTILLGALSTYLEFPAALWEEAIERCVPPGTVAVNRRAFEEGRRLEPRPLPSAERWLPPGPGAAWRVAVAANWCKACDICVRVCPESILRPDGRGAVEVVAHERCTGCRLCEWLCPEFAITVHARAAAGVGR
ncbi:MAG: 2-oxoacid:acceptor oxidoreductase family protein, partial [Armatimonadota bacterium]|nr:2-oxoacid:acceptor oxidoreductase family protein [Armatimonadota bacterium]